MSDAVLRQFYHELLNPDLSFYPYPNPAGLIGSVRDGTEHWISEKLKNVINLMHCRTAGWHKDSIVGKLTLMQVVSGHGFRVQGLSRNPQEQTLGTIILLDQTKRHRLLAPNQNIREVWSAIYAEVPIECAEWSDSELAEVLKFWEPRS